MIAERVSQFFCPSEDSLRVIVDPYSKIVVVYHIRNHGRIPLELSTQLLRSSYQRLSVRSHRGSWGLPL